VSEHIPMIASVLAALAAGRLAAWPTTTRLRRRLAHALWQLRRDPLTGLLSRTGFTEAYTARSTEPTTVVLLDLDGFKAVNDTHGHGAGDQLLTTVAERIHSAAVLHAGIAARLSGDEFAAILPTTTDIDRAVDLILALLAAPVTVTIDDTTVTLTVTASAGVCIAAPGDTVDQALRHADIALHHAKTTSGVCTHYQSGMHMPPAPTRKGPRLRDRRDDGRGQR
jgi:diguanylate cyclase (GGDEF)-like protein